LKSEDGLRETFGEEFKTLEKEIQKCNLLIEGKQNTNN